MSITNERLAQIAKTGCEGSFYASPETAAAIAAEVLTLREHRDKVLTLLDQLDAAESALARVRELHAPVEVEPSDTICAACSHQIGSGSRIRWMPTVEWPCPTICALDATPGGES